MLLRGVVSAFLIIAAVAYLLGSTILSIPLPDVMRGSVNLGARTLPVHRVFVIFAGVDNRQAVSHHLCGLKVLFQKIETFGRQFFVRIQD